MAGGLAGCAILGLIALPLLNGAPQDSEQVPANSTANLRSAEAATAAQNGQEQVETQPATPGCLGSDRFFADEVWAKVAELSCLKCHIPEGDAADSDFVLVVPADVHDDKAMTQNCQSFRRMAQGMEDNQSRLLAKATGGLGHGGGQVVKADSTGFRILERFVQRATGKLPPPVASEAADDYTAPLFFDGVTMLSPQRHLRRLTLSLAARLPTQKEVAAVEQDGPAALDSILDQILQEEAFYLRLKEGFNDIFLTMGLEQPAEFIFSYEHFEKSRSWFMTYDLSHIADPAQREKALWKMMADYREALIREPSELIAYIVRHDRPISELATADHIMVSPYTARGYGIFEGIKDQFKNPDDPFEFIPARLPPIRHSNGKLQETPDGVYPHAGYLTMFQYLRRYPTTETNRNRLRARMLYQHFLGVDVLQLAPRVTDAAAVTAKYKIPTMEAADCVVCHKTLDPVAGIFQEYDMEGHFNPRKDGWHTDMFQPGYEGESLPDEQRARKGQWLAERLVKDPRFPVAMTEHVYYILMGRKVLRQPEDIDDPLYAAKRRSYRAQRQWINEVAVKLAASNLNLKVAFKQLALSEFYRADGLATSTLHPQRRAELDEVGIVRLLSPEQIDRKLIAIFGKPFARMDELKTLYGGIDSQLVTERNPDPGGAMGAVQRLMANDVACNHVTNDFLLPLEQRKLFPHIELTDLPGKEESNQRILRSVQHLHHFVLGQELAEDHAEIQRSYELFTEIVREAKEQPALYPNENWFCGGRDAFTQADPQFTLRAWRAVLTYLLRQHEFLYE